ncbi:hypothetical protein ACOMHN_060259 [Nucella lapillus]
MSKLSCSWTRRLDRRSEPISLPCPTPYSVFVPADEASHFVRSSRPELGLDSLGHAPEIGSPLQNNVLGQRSISTTATASL